ncbi:MAG: O-antigen ligase family protein [Firmicutes bacterium]|nr:O-antigen ligase family protein [Bacillota bacterium]
MSNANSLGRYCTALILISAFALLRTSGKLRIPFAVSQLIGWFCLGLANSRSAIICIAFFAALMTLFTVRDRALNRNASLSLKAGLIIAASVALVFVLVISLFYIPTHLFKSIVSAFAMATGNSKLLSNVSVPTVRNMTTDLATMEDRILIWERCLQDVFSTPRRTWLGVSDQNIDKITGVYPGHHEILTVNAHNMFLELLMRQGLIGLSIWLVLIVLWCTAGIRILFDPEEPLHIRCLAAAAAAILINGLAEAVPFSSTTGSGLSTPFFVICAYCMNNRRSKE